MLTMSKKKKGSARLTNPWPDRLRGLRLRHGDISQSQAAALLDVPLKTFQNWEQGRNRPSAALAKLIGLVFPG